MEGVRNLVDAAREVCPGAIFVHTSSADTILPRPKFLRLGLDFYWGGQMSKIVTGDYDEVHVDSGSMGCYRATKWHGEKIVRAANGKGLKTGILRPGG